MIQALGVVVSFLIIIILVVKRINYGLALLAGAFILGIFFELNPQCFLEVFMLTLTDLTTLDLALIISLIPILAFCMRETGMTDKLVTGTKTMLSSRAVLVGLPALMGALPVIGGALLSAPLIDDEAKRLGLASEERSFINVWFRHWNFFIYPLSPQLIFVASLTSVDLYRLILIQVFPLLIYLLLGYIISIRRVEKDEEIKRGKDLKVLSSVLLNVAPILLVITLHFIRVHMAAALAAGIVFVLLFKRVSPKRATALLRRGFDWKLLFTIVSAMYLRHMIGYSKAVSAILPYMESTGLPTTLLLILITCTVAFVTAVPTASIAIIFSVASMMVKTFTITLVSVLYLTMFFFYLISPMHLCLIVTVEYYKSRLYAVYRKLIPASVATYLISLAVTLGVRFL